MSPSPSKLPTISRQCSLCAVALCLVILSTTYYSLKQPGGSRKPDSELTDRFLSLSCNSTISNYLRSLTHIPHVAGTHSSLSVIEYVVSHFSSLQLPTRTVRYYPLLSYPKHASINVHFGNGSAVTISSNPENSKDKLLVVPYHAYSPSGAATAEVVFVNFGRAIDYQVLDDLGVNVSGRVVLVRRGNGMSRARAVEVAEKNEAAAVLMFTEWDKEGRTEKDFQGGVERGTVMRRGIGDPLTPGWAAVGGGERLPLEDSRVQGRFSKIPSYPLSFRDADVILSSLGGPEAPSLWNYPNRFVGPGPTIVNFTYKEDRKVSEIQNVFAVIQGTVEPDRYVLLGNHRDAWTYGAVDPSSGTAVLLDLARRFALLMKTGWKPRRTIVLCSWDAEEFGMVGSTEWVEENLINLREKAVAYLNVDCAVQGPGLFASSTPQLDNLILEILQKVEDADKVDALPGQHLEHLKENITIQRLSGVDSDFAPFLHHAGVPSIDLYYGKDFPVYHTAFDSYEWMIRNADPWFLRHVAVADIWGLIALRLADDAVLPFDYFSYAMELKKYKDDLSNILDNDIDLQPLSLAIEKLTSASKKSREEAQHLRAQDTSDSSVALQVRALNDKQMIAERGFLDADGVQRRPWFKHLIYGLAGEFGGKVEVFPGIAEALTLVNLQERAATLQHEVWRVSRVIENSAAGLDGGLS